MADMISTANINSRNKSKPVWEKKHMQNTTAAYTKHYCQVQIPITPKGKLSSYKKHNVTGLMPSSQVSPVDDNYSRGTSHFAIVNNYYNSAYIND